MKELLFVGATEDLQSLADDLQQAGFIVSACEHGELAERLADGDAVDALLLNVTDQPADATLRQLLDGQTLPPHMAALAVLRRTQIGELTPSTPVDDFIAFPSPPDELLMRVRRAIWRRGGGESAETLRCGDLTIDQQSYRVYIGGRSVELTYKEYELLRFLALNEDKVCTREMLLNRVWGYDFYGGSRTVDVHIRRLRSKIEDRAHTFIETVRNVGYRFHVS
ncbi:MAG: response regulator transcription factor [Dehalococcoidia bacterium]